MSRPKYGAVPTIVDGIRFASKREAERYKDLRLMERAGHISDLELQPRFVIAHRGVRICTYVADFAYTKDGERVTEDCKGFRTPVYKLKRKLVKAFYGIDILET